MADNFYGFDGKMFESIGASLNFSKGNKNLVFSVEAIDSKIDKDVVVGGISLGIGF